MASSISVSVASLERPSILYGPVPVVVTVRNLFSSSVQILLPYPNPNNLRFDCTTQGFTTQKVVAREEIERSVPISLDPGSSYTATYYFNRYFTFQKAGEGKISYRLSILVTSPGGTNQSHENTVFTGEFTVKLVESSEDNLRIELAKHAQNLRSSDRQVKTEAAEALAFLDTPLSVDYIAPMLSIDNLETIGIRALGRHPSPKTADLIVGMLSHRDSAVVAAALDEINRLKISIPRRTIQELLAAENPNTRWLALEWLAARPDNGDLSIILPLLNDENPVVRERANVYVKALRKN